MMSELTPKEVEEVQTLPAPEERFDLACPDCGAPLKLKVGRFGRFYGCSTWGTTRCKGTHGASLTGAPLGVPAEASVRKLRARVMQHLEERATRFPVMGDDAYIDFVPLPDLPEGSVSTWGR